jgi:hypothetical protein
MTFQPGHTYSPGRRPGSRNKRNAELFERLENRGDLDPAELLSSIVTNTQEPGELRIQAAGLLMPYKYGKHGSIPPARYVELEIDIPEFNHVSDAEAFLARIALLCAKGHLDIQSAQELSGLVKTWIDSQYAKEELQFKINPPEERDLHIRIEGGLSDGQVNLPGTNIIQPEILENQNKPINGHALAAPESVITPAELKAHGPHPLQEHHFKPEPEPLSPGQNPATGNGKGSP